MSYSPRFDVRWVTPNTHCRLLIEQEYYSGPVEQLPPAPAPFRFEGGQSDLADLALPIRTTGGTISVIGDTAGQQLLEVFDAGATEYRVRLQTQGPATGERFPSGATYNTSLMQTVWTGYIAPDELEYDPYSDTEIIQVRAIDGLSLLADRAGTYQTGDSLAAAITEPLKGLHAGLEVIINMEWQPYTDPVIGPYQLPLERLYADETAFRTNPDDSSSPPVNQKAQLEQVLSRFGLELFQSEGAWHVRQRHRINTSKGNLKVWTEGASLPQTAQVERPVPANLLPKERPADFVGRLKSAESRFEHGEIAALIENGDFEDPLGGTWEILDTGSTGGKEHVKRELHSNEESSNVDWLPKETQEDSYSLWLYKDTNPLDSGAQEVPDSSIMQVRQETKLNLLPGGERYSTRLSFDYGSYEGADYVLPKVTVSGTNGTYYLTYAFTEARNNPKAAENGYMKIAAVPGAEEGTVLVPAGAKVYSKYRNQDIPDDADAHDVGLSITLSEPLRVGDTRIKGRIPDLANVDVDRLVIYYPVWTAQETPFFFPAEAVSGMELFDAECSNVTPDGTTIRGELTLEFGSATYDTGSPRDYVTIDNVVMEVRTTGDVIDSFSTVASVNQPGSSWTETHRLGDGPVGQSPFSLRARFSPEPDEMTSGWIEGVYYTGDNPAGQGIEELLTTTILRYQRDSLQRYSYEFELRGGEDLWLHDVLEIEGTYYTVAYLERTFGTGAERVRCELVELRDSGTSGMEVGYGYNLKGQASGGGGAAAGGSVLVTEGEGVSSFAQLTDVPDLIYADSVAEALGFDPINPTGDSQDLDLGGNALLLGDGQLQGDGNGALEVLDAAGANHGTLIVDRLIVKGSVDQRNTNELAVDDQYIVTAAGQTGTPSLNAGLRVERGDGSDAYLEWDEGADRFGERLANGTFQPLVLEDSTRWDISISGDAYTLDGYAAADFAALAESETVTGSWTFDAEVNVNNTLNANDTLMVGADSFLLGALEVYGGGLIEGGLDVEEGLTVSGGATIVGGLTSSGGATIDDLTVSGSTITPAYGNDLTITTQYNQDIVLSPHFFGGVRLSGSTYAESGLYAESIVSLEDDIYSRHHTDKRSGWRITYGGRADLRGLYADELVVKSFTTDLTQALAGSDYLVKSVATLADTFDVPSPGQTAVLRVNDLPGQEGVAAFEDGDYVRLRVIDQSSGGMEVIDVWGTVSGYTDEISNEQTWTFTRHDDNWRVNGEHVGKNAPVLDYGKSGDGLIRRTVEGSSAPYTAIETWTSDPSVPSNYTTRALLGNLDAAPTLPSGTNPTGWGLYSTNAYLKGHIEASSGDIADWQIQTNRLKKSYSDGRLEAGTLTWGSTTGFGFNGGFGEAQIGERGGDPNLLVYDDGSNFVEVGAGYNRSEMGITVKTSGNTVLYTDRSTAYIDNIEVRSNATIHGGLKVGEFGLNQLIWSYDSGRSGTTSWNNNTDINGAKTHTFQSESEGRVLIRVYANDAEGARVGLNGKDLGRMYRTGPDRSEEWYSFSSDNLQAGENTIQLWSTSGDGGHIDYIEIYGSSRFGTGQNAGRGVITASKLAAGAVTADLIDTDDLFAKDATITASLTMGAGSAITNSGGDYYIDDQGIALDGDDLSDGFREAKSIVWYKDPTVRTDPLVAMRSNCIYAKNDFQVIAAYDFNDGGLNSTGSVTLQGRNINLWSRGNVGGVSLVGKTVYMRTDDWIELDGEITTHPPEQWTQGNHVALETTAGGVLKANGGTAPYRINVQDGHGRVHHLWNAYDAGSNHKAYTGGEGCSWMEMGGGHFYFRTASDQTGGNQSIGWETTLSLYHSSQSSYTAVVNGDFQAGGYYQNSDRKLKTNIRTISGALDRLDYLRGVQFDWTASGKADAGLIAQDVAQILPEAVQGDETLSVSYNAITGLLVEAVKEQQKEIDRLRTQLGI